jgi:hypothetical protein
MTAHINSSFVHRLTTVADTAQIDAFGRQRVSSPVTIFDSKQIIDGQPLLWDTQLSAATGTHSIAGAKTTLALLGNGGSPGVAIRQTFMRFPYQPGKSQLIFTTFRATQETGVTKRVGLFRATTTTAAPVNGIFFEVTGTDCAWCVANGGTITRVAQSEWNQSRMLDANEACGVVLNLSAPQIAIIDFEWLGVGRVRVGFVIRGCVVYCHEFWCANEVGQTGVYMATPNLPMCATINGSAATTTGSMDAICSTVISEGGMQESGIMFSHSNGVTAITASSTANTYALVGLRLNSSTQDAHIQIKSISVTSTSTAKDYLVQLILNPTIAGAQSWSTSAPPVDRLTGVAANTITGGQILHQAYVNAEAAIGVPVEMMPNLGANIAGTSDVLVVAVRPLQANVDAYAAINWLEME